MTLLKKLFILSLCASLSLPIFAKTSNQAIFIVETNNCGDYCWITGTVQQGKQAIKKTFLVRAPKLMADTPESEKSWPGKRLKITTATTQMCEHNPPCQKGDTFRQVDVITGFKVLN